MSKSEKMGEFIPEKQIEFNVHSEKWHVYELEDKSTIRFKTVLIDIYDAGPAEGEMGAQGIRKAFFNMKLLSSVFSPKKMREKKGQVWPISELEKNIIKPNLMFRQLKDGGFAEYETSNSKLQIKTILRQVDRTSKFGSMGNPAYIIRTESEVLIEKKPTVNEQNESET